MRRPHDQDITNYCPKCTAVLDSRHDEKTCEEKQAKRMSERTSKNVSFDRPKLERLKLALEQAPGDRDAVFEFEGEQYVKAYARYLIEYLETALPPVH